METVSVSQMQIYGQRCAHLGVVLCSFAAMSMFGSFSLGLGSGCVFAAHRLLALMNIKMSLFQCKFPSSYKMYLVQITGGISSSTISFEMKVHSVQYKIFSENSSQSVKLGFSAKYSVQNLPPFFQCKVRGQKYLVQSTYKFKNYTQCKFWFRMIFSANSKPIYVQCNFFQIIQYNFFQMKWLGQSPSTCHYFSANSLPHRKCIQCKEQGRYFLVQFPQKCQCKVFSTKYLVKTP